MEFGKLCNFPFRRVVLEAYKGICAVCGARIITSSGISIIDAAHILPFHKFRNDDDIILPAEPEKHPSPIALKWHRDNIFVM